MKHYYPISLIFSIQAHRLLAKKYNVLIIFAYIVFFKKKQKPFVLVRSRSPTYMCICVCPTKKKKKKVFSITT